MVFFLPTPVFVPIKFVVNDKEVTKIMVLPEPRSIPVTMAVTYVLYIKSLNQNKALQPHMNTIPMK